MTPIRAAVLTGLLGAVICAPARALDYQVHGFAAQAYLLSEGNNFFGDSTNGSHDFYEVGLNGAVSLGHGLLASAQGLIRDAGPSDTGKPRLDYALIDWSAIQSVEATAGIRVGRVKNRFGLYNDTRDVVFARPGILLPQSIYFEAMGLRSLLFSSDGAQLYGSRTLDAHELSLTFSVALDRDLSEKEKEVLTSAFPGPDEIRIEDLSFTQVSDSWNGGRVVFALSHVRARLMVEPSPTFPVDVEGRFGLSVVSLRYNAERYSLTGEYMYARSDVRSSIQGRTKSSQDGGYVQADYRPADRWSMFARYDASFSDADDRNGREAARTPGVQRHSRFAHDLAVGAGWLPDAHWGLWAEVHRIYGTATVSLLDNPGGADDERWTLLTLMAGYRF